GGRRRLFLRCATSVASGPTPLLPTAQTRSTYSSNNSPAVDPERAAGQKRHPSSKAEVHRRNRSHAAASRDARRKSFPGAARSTTETTKSNASAQIGRQARPNNHAGRQKAPI